MSPSSVGLFTPLCGYSLHFGPQPGESSLSWERAPWGPPSFRQHLLPLTQPLALPSLSRHEAAGSRKRGLLLSQEELVLEGAVHLLLVDSLWV